MTRCISANDTPRPPLPLVVCIAVLLLSAGFRHPGLHSQGGNATVRTAGGVGGVQEKD